MANFWEKKKKIPPIYILSFSFPFYLSALPFIFKHHTRTPPTHCTLKTENVMTVNNQTANFWENNNNYHLFFFVIFSLLSRRSPFYVSPSLIHCPLKTKIRKTENTQIANFWKQQQLPSAFFRFLSLFISALSLSCSLSRPSQGFKGSWTKNLERPHSSLSSWYIS